MKHNNISKFLGAFAVLVATVALPSCVKDRNTGAPDFSTTTATVLIPEGGLGSKFSSQTVLFPGTDALDSTTFYINYAAKDVAPADVVVTLAIDNAALAAYNASHPTSQYVLFPDSTFSFSTTKVTIKAGQNYSAPIRVYFKPNKIDIASNYMLPISIKDASGNNISGNFGTIYYHFIGNPLAGTYDVVGVRYNYATNVPGASGTFDGNPAHVPAGYVSTTAIPTPKTAAAVDGNTISMDFANLGSNGYLYLFTQTGNFASLNIDFNDVMKAGDSQIKTWLVSYRAPNAITHVKAKFRVFVQYNNTVDNTGSDRLLDEEFTQR